MMDAVQGKDGTDIQRFWTKARRFRSEKGKKQTKKNPTQQEQAKGFTKSLTLIQKNLIKNSLAGNLIYFPFCSSATE